MPGMPQNCFPAAWHSKKTRATRCRRSQFTNGCSSWIRNTRPIEQLRETLVAFDLARSALPFTRCAVCNGSLRTLARRSVASLVPARVRERHDKFARCTLCGRIYWPGTHTLRIRKALQDASIDLLPQLP